MSWVPPLLVAIPLLSAAAIAGGDHVTPQPIQKAVAQVAALANTALAILLMLSAERHDVLHWFAGWQPRHGVAIGIDFVADPFAAAMCAVISAVVTIAIAYSLTYMKEAARLFEALFLTALAAMCGFAMSGDIFNMFVWIELMGVAGYALTGFKVDQLGPIQGAINFAIVNTLGGYLFAVGIALLYARTGALNLAQIGQTLMTRGGGGLAIVAMTFVFGGLLTKGAAVPFHFWAADAYAVAPAPVCAMLGAVMTDIGLIGVARIYFTVFAGVFGHHEAAVRDVLLTIGVATALLGGTMALLQRHLKRMLAYSVVCHIGIMLAGISFLSAKGLGGAAAMFVANAFLTAALFLVAGVLLARYETIDELRLRGRARGDWWCAGVWFAGAFGLAGLPYVGTYLGHSLIDDAAGAALHGWVEPLLWLGGALASAGIVRAGLRAFAGLGPTRSPLLGSEIEEEPIIREISTPLAVGAAVVALAIGLLVSVVPGLGQRAEAGAARLQDRGGYAGEVLHARAAPRPPRPPYAIETSTPLTIWFGVGAVLVTLGVGAAGVVRHPAGRELAERVLGPPAAFLKSVHTGVVGDYIMWLVVGTAIIGGIWAKTLP